MHPLGLSQGRNFVFCLGFQCPVSKECRVVRFYYEVAQSSMQQSNFRPYFATESRLQENLHLFSNPLANLMTSVDFRRENTLTRILRMANLDIADIANDCSLI
jgi:hypothetical protein